MSEEQPTPEEKINKLKKKQAPTEQEEVGDILSSVNKSSSDKTVQEKEPFQQKKKRKWKLIVAIVILALLVVGLTALFTFEQIRNTVIEPEVQEEIIREMPEPVEVEEGENPFAAMLEEEDKEYPGSGDTNIVTDTEEETFAFESSGITLAPVNVESFEPAVDMECTLSNTTDICLIGTVSFDNDNLKPVDVFAVQNMLEFRLFEGLNASDEAFNVEGAEAGLHGAITVNDITTLTAGIVVEDGSGFVLTISDVGEGHDFSLYQESFTIQ